ncbi:MAG: hypothetical protein O6934_04760 [SAR324 cluster bacterium]|nr:hypothetical protein [SAR324 cluster bacterium]
MRLLFLTILLLALGFGAGQVSAQDTPVKYAGTYKIEFWRDFERRGMFHFFHLQPGGGFLLGAEWPGKESSRAAGAWSVSGGKLSLDGTVWVETNQGKWRVPFHRVYTISVSEKGIWVKPWPAKNRFGLLGWPNAYYYFRARISPNLPAGGIPTDPGALGALIQKLKGPRR